MAAKTIKVYTVLADGTTPGPACDYIHTHRFKHEGDAKTFASTATHYGRPASVMFENAPAKLVRRWEGEGKIQ